MGSYSDWYVMEHAYDLLKQYSVECTVQVISAHRTPGEVISFAESAEAYFPLVIIAAAGGAAHLPGLLAASSSAPVIGVPVSVAPLNGIDSLLSIVQMPRGVPVATMAIGIPGAINAAILAIQILAFEDPIFNAKIQSIKLNLVSNVEDQNLLLQEALNNRSSLFRGI